MSIKSQFHTVLGTVLAAAVADDGTFAVAYPTGTTQKTFTGGFAGSGHYVVLNNNDKWSYADPGINVSFDASEITITNRSGESWAAGTKVDIYLDVTENRRQVVTLAIGPLAGITAADLITDMRLGLDGYLVYAEFVTTVAVTTASKAATLNFEIGSTDVTGMTLALTSATVTPKGKVLAFGLPTANNRITKESLLSLEASAVTAFAEGEGYINLHVLLDEPDAY